jgi:hypothetical protein
MAVLDKVATACPRTLDRQPDFGGPPVRAKTGRESMAEELEKRNEELKNY